MSRPSSYHDRSELSSTDSFSLPLFNPPPPPLPLSSRPQQSDSGVGYLPPPPTVNVNPGSQHQHQHQHHHQSRHSINHHPHPSSAFGSTPYDVSPQTAPPLAGNMHRSTVSAGMPSGMGYSSPYAAGGRMEELLPPPSTSSLAALARSASLGARKKDPYAYSSDDVESGLGQMDMGGGEGRWGQRGRPGYNGLVDGDVVMSPSLGPKVYPPPPPPQAGPMQPPPVPAHALTRPAQPSRNDSGGSSPGLIPSFSHNNPYVPRASDPGPSTYTNDFEYRRPNSSNRIPSSSSYHSEHRSPFMSSDTAISSPHSPLLNPYDASPNLIPQHAASPISPAQQDWTNTFPPSPSGSRPPAGLRAYSHQPYPASQPVTPAGKFELGPPRGARDPRSKQGSNSRQGFREVKDWSDLKPVMSDRPSGRRADPNRPGNYLSPLQCLTSALPQTYALCNPQFRYESSENPRRVLTKPSKGVHNDGADNEDWDYILYVNDVLGGEHGGDRYLILDVLGQGTFGQVVKCQNMRTHDICAVKVVKNKPAYLNQSKMEVAILDLLNTQYDPQDQHHILRMLESFTHKSHLCLVFECLSLNLYELIKQNQFKGLSTQLVKVLTHQLLECLAVLKDARLIHCDLKPENILLKSLQSPQIKVIDFGSACHEMQTVYTYIQSRFYRSPEVLLGLPYSTSIDMWSLGCIVVELFLGLPLFPGTSEYNQLSRIVDMLGNPPGHLLEVGKQTHEFFNYVGSDGRGRKIYQLKSLDQYSQEHRTNEQPSKQYFKQTKLKDIVMEYPFSKKNPKQSDIDKEMALRRSFVDFVEGLLNLDPIKRWSPQQAAKHPFVTGEKFSGPFQPPSVPSKKSHSPAASPGPPASKKYGGLVQTPNATRGQRVHSDAAVYNHQITQHQGYSSQSPAQAQAQQASAKAVPFSSGYDTRQRMPSHGHSGQWQNTGPPQVNYQPRIPSHSANLSASSSHSALRQPPAMINTNPPPNSYYPGGSRNRSNTINQMDVIPPALARLTHMSMPDPSGQRNLTPVLNRGDDAYKEWERRQAGGHSRKVSTHIAATPQLQYLQEQAELAATGGHWMMPGAYNHGGHGQGQGHGQGHRSRPSGGGYQMQPHIGLSPSSPSGPSPGYHHYDTQQSSQYASNRPYLPAFPPPAATNTGTGTFDGFDGRDAGMGMMYTPLQPQGYLPSPGAGGGAGYGGVQGGHQARASFSGPYGPGTMMNNPFAPPPHAQSGQSGPQSPRYQRRSGQYGV